MREFIEDYGPVLIVMALLMALIVAVSYADSRYGCHTYEEVTGKPTKYAAWTCYVQEGGTWMAWEEYKLRFATQGAN